MGFWGSLVEGAKSAGGWVLDHAGDIANVVGTVAKISGTVVLLQVDAPNADDSGTHLKDFFRNFQIASDKLKETAKSAVDHRSAELRGSAGQSTEGATTEDSIAGIWKHPAPLAQGQPPLDMYHDLSKWLALLGVPASQDVDVAAAVAQAIFPDLKNVSSVDETLIRTSDFAYAGPSGSWRLDIAHAYYPLPLGASKEDDCWHSCVYGRLTQIQSTNDNVVAASASPAALTTTGVTLNKIEQSTPTWVVNATIGWANANVAAMATPLLVKNLEGDTSLKLIYTSLLGCSQMIQVQCDINGTPATVKNSIVSGAAQVLSTLYAADSAGKADSSIPPLVPEVEITNSQIIFSQ